MGRQELLKFLLDIAGHKQVFIATQDPSFVNPVLYGDHIERVSVQLFSLQNQGFIAIDLRQSMEDPSVFAGYLPHTTSLRSIHIYVEGASDAYIFQVWLRKFLSDAEAHDKKITKQIAEGNSVKETGLPYRLGERFQIENKIGFFHLCGDLWPHLLYTVPKSPYRCVVILDGDKKDRISEVVKKHNESELTASKFEFARSIEEFANIIKAGLCHPIYCLKKDRIEDYLSLGHQPLDYDKKVDGPRAAERLEELPKEIFDLFFSIL
jgi:hypothetical protein